MADNVGQSEANVREDEAGRGIYLHSFVVPKVEVNPVQPESHPLQCQLQSSCSWDIDAVNNSHKRNNTQADIKTPGQYQSTWSVLFPLDTASEELATSMFSPSTFTIGSLPSRPALTTNSSPLGTYIQRKGLSVTLVWADECT